MTQRLCRRLQELERISAEVSAERATTNLRKVGDIQVALRKVDVKRSRYTVDVLADDQRVEKKDKGANEPVQFYTSRARQPYELVINQVKNNQVVGYLATPKVIVSTPRAALTAADAQKQ